MKKTRCDTRHTEIMNTHSPKEKRRCSIVPDGLKINCQQDHFICHIKVKRDIFRCKRDKNISLDRVKLFRIT